MCRLPDLWRVGVGDSDRCWGGGLPWAVDSLDGRFFGWFGVGALAAWGAVVLMFGWCVMNSRCAWALFVARDRGALGRRGIGEFAVEDFVSCLAWDRHWGMCWWLHGSAR